MDDSYLMQHELATGRWAGIVPLTFGRARIVVMERETSMTYDDGW